MTIKQMISALGGVLLLSASAAVFADANGGGKRAQESVPAGSLAGNVSAALCTVAINADGTIAGGPGQLASSSQLAAFPGAYEVIFKNQCTNITAANGWARFVQVDTFTTGVAAPLTCTTADRFGQPNGVFVQCTNPAGVGTNGSFFLMVTR